MTKPYVKATINHSTKAIQLTINDTVVHLNFRQGSDDLNRMDHFAYDVADAIERWTINEFEDDPEGVSTFHPGPRRIEIIIT